jgi:DNA-binding CsgD family transcriptional regulator
VARLPNESPYASRAYALAGQALYLGSGSEQAVEFHQRARELATEEDDLKRSLWGLFMTENELGSDGAEAHLAELEAMASDDADLDTRLRVAVGRQATGARKGSFGGVLETSLPLVPIAALADDPMARTTFLANVSYLCVAHADYARGLELATKALRESEILGLAFAKGYCLATIALAHAGLRAYRSAHQSLRDLANVASDQDNTYLECSAEITSMRVALMRGDAEGAIEGRSLEFVDSIPVAGAKGEYLGALTVGAAASGNLGMYHASLTETEGLGGGIESQFFTQWARLIIASRQGVATTDAFWELFESAAQASFEDIFVVGYRLQPALLDLVQRKDPRARKVVGVLKRANDHAIASSRFPADAPFDRHSTLTPREHEVLGLLAAGLSNAEIAERLFISPSTAKVHVQHILRKLGVKTRLQAAMQAYGLSKAHCKGGSKFGVALCLHREVRARPREVCLAGLSQDCFKRGNYRRVELAADCLSQAEARHSARHRVSVRTARRHRVVCVGDCDDSRDEGNFIPLQLVRISVPIDALVMVANDPGNFSVVFDLREDPLPNRGVLLHSPPLFQS